MALSSDTHCNPVSPLPAESNLPNSAPGRHHSSQPRLCRLSPPGGISPPGHQPSQTLQGTCLAPASPSQLAPVPAVGMTKPSLLCHHGAWSPPSVFPQPLRPTPSASSEAGDVTHISATWTIPPFLHHLRGFLFALVPCRSPKWITSLVHSPHRGKYGSWLVTKASWVMSY